MRQDRARQLRPLVELLRDPPADADVPTSLRDAVKALRTAVAGIPAETRKKWEYEVLMSAASEPIRQAFSMKDD